MHVPFSRLWHCPISTAFLAFTPCDTRAKKPWEPCLCQAREWTRMEGAEALPSTLLLGRPLSHTPKLASECLKATVRWQLRISVNFVEWKRLGTTPPRLVKGFVAQSWVSFPGLLSVPLSEDIQVSWERPSFYDVERVLVKGCGQGEPAGRGHGRFAGRSASEESTMDAEGPESSPQTCVCRIRRIHRLPRPPSCVLLLQGPWGQRDVCFFPTTFSSIQSFWYLEPNKYFFCSGRNFVCKIWLQMY